MKLREREHTHCSSCGHVNGIKQEEEYGCDACKKPINMGNSENGKHRGHLEAVVFRNNQESERLHFCSWRCCIAKLKKVKTDYFVSLPYLTFDETTPGLRAKDFFSVMRPSTRKA